MASPVKKSVSDPSQSKPKPMSSLGQLPPKPTAKENKDVSKPHVVLIGNSGVGKSYLCNFLLGGEQFKHVASATSVTSEVEYADWNLEDGTPYTIVNMPGLLEADQKKWKRNVIALTTEMSHPSKKVVVFVLSNENGRLMKADVIMLQEFCRVYGYHPESMILVLNSKPKHADGKWIVDMTKLVASLMKWEIIPTCVSIGQMQGKTPTFEQQGYYDNLYGAIIAAKPISWSAQHTFTMPSDEQLSLLQKQLHQLQQQAKDQKEVQTAAVQKTTQTNTIKPTKLTGPTGPRDLKTIEFLLCPANPDKWMQYINIGDRLCVMNEMYTGPAMDTDFSYAFDVQDSKGVLKMHWYGQIRKIETHTDVNYPIPSGTVLFVTRKSMDADKPDNCCLYLMTL